MNMESQKLMLKLNLPGCLHSKTIFGVHFLDSQYKGKMTQNLNIYLILPSCTDNKWQFYTQPDFRNRTKLFRSVVDSKEAPWKYFLLFFLLSYWLKSNHLKC